MSSPTGSGREKPTWPALLAEYAVAPVLRKVRVPLMDEVSTIDPPFSFIKGTAYLAAWYIEDEC